VAAGNILTGARELGYTPSAMHCAAWDAHCPSCYRVGGVV
jgi:hypothetical protein